MISKKTTLPLLFIFPLLVVMVLLGTLNTPTMAAPDGTITVNTLLDENDGSCTDGDCSLRDAIATTNAGDTIDFSIAGTIILSSTPNYLGELIIDKSLTIDGQGTITVSGNNAVRVFNVLTSTSPIIGVTFDSIIIANGYDQNLQATNCPPHINLCGGGIMIQNSDATITLSNSILISNTADWGGGIFNHGTLLVISSTISENSARSGSGGGIVNAGMMMVNDSTISSNSATDNGGGIYTLGTSTVSNSIISSNSADNSSGAIYNLGTITVSDSTITNNSAEISGGIINGDMMIINNSTISNNTATAGNGGGIFNFGSGVMVINNSAISDNSAVYYSGGIGNYGMITINNSTISGNSADYGGGIHNNGTITVSNSTISDNSARNGLGGGFYNGYNNTANISNSTISGNSATDHGGGIYNDGSITINSSTITNNHIGTAGGGISSYGDPYANATITNTIISGNIISGTTTPNDLALYGGITDTFTSGGHNLIGTIQAEITAFNATGDQTGINNPKLNNLSNNGGETFTHALQFDSLAIDSGDSCGTTDQRGYMRPKDGDGDGNAICDIGAYEYTIYNEFIFLPVIVK